ncbi:hypothetical protein K435DRAFT_801967 [Dendrothele bispora CBS 962.96]|uniref:Glycoside hydrolase family 76 protein n=1 Tax=Dendrothele bispora (strain CBS 962.96) TaxID=1314807 RepID=A0A4S8LMN7_DENBC|nr:hypothetical protein K435DRAFT_801967 [Dendrothele bispora CBS 962.96]
MRSSVKILLMFPWFIYVFGQSITVPASWLNTSINVSPEDRVTIAGNAIQKSLLEWDQPKVQFTDSNSPTLSSTFLSDLAIFDMYNNQTQFKDQVIDALTQIQSTTPNFENQLDWGYAAITAYRTYQETILLEYAELSWNFGWNWTLTPTGHTGFKSVEVPASCNGSSTVGGSFRETSPDNIGINMLATGYYIPFMTLFYCLRLLSASLAEATSNQTYLDAASNAANFIHNHLTDSNNVIRDGLDLNNNCVQSSSIILYNSALAVHGLAILTSLTKNSTQEQWLSDIIQGAVFPSKDIDISGVLTTADTHVTFGMSAIQGYSNDPTLQAFARQFMGIQYNAILDQATVDGSNIYQQNWAGPKPSTVPTLKSSAQTSAINVLVSQLTTGTNTRNPETTADTTVLPTSTSQGGVGLIALAGLALLFLHKRSLRGRHKREYTVPFTSSSMITPFWSTTAETGSHDPTAQGKAHHYRSPNTTESGIIGTRPSGKSQRIESQPHTVLTSPSHSSAPISTVSVQNRGELSTEELVRMLNERLQYGTIRSGELPPEYPATEL